ncbi:bifunctional 3-demethylubiquinone 3-O-methyltransferase/2-octaprenyl-6-hydroxy phenol methylase [cyanobacterium TDX16]|nr:bifunctional 3-demethylubiquinone 3-O-methyltransferase/2-octaprenyl-6-hydroxy phenol methylase [cyanobacterium TDX16]
MKKNDLEFYDRSAAQWWQPDAKIYALHRLNPLRFQYFDRHLTNWQGLRVLDVGCGGGFSCEFLAARGAKVFGIDRSQSCIATAKAHAATSGFKIDYQYGYAEDLPYADRYFDVVVCVDVLEHVTNWQQTVTEIHRVLRPGGTFCFDTINRTVQSQLMMIWFLEGVVKAIDRGIHDWEKFIKPEELTSLMQQQSFTNIDIKGFSLFGSSPWDAIATFWHYKKTGSLRASITDNTSVMYIGKAEKTARS